MLWQKLNNFLAQKQAKDATASMLTKDELQRIFTEKTEQIKKRDSKKITQYTDVYEKSIVQRDRICVHADGDKFPEALFVARAPNQTDVEFKYLEANFRACTTVVWEKFQSGLSRIWGDQNWKIDYKGNDNAKQYLEVDYPTYGSLEAYFKDVVTTVKELDNNGVIGLVLDLPYLPSIVDGKEVFPSISDREQLSPMAHYFSCEKVIGFQDGVYAVVITDEKSPVITGNKTSLEGIVIDIYDNTFIYRIYQKGKKSDWQFELIEYFKHDLGVLPVKKLNGKAEQIGEDVFYRSSFIPAVNSLDSAILDDSYLSAIKAKCAYPKEWEYSSECDYQNEDGNRCIAGMVQGNEGVHKCPSCAGTGKQRPGILGVKQIKISEMTGMGSNIPTPPGGFYGPTTEIIQLLSDQVDRSINKGASILNIDISNSEVKGSETALGKQIDREEQFSFIKRISDQVFQIFEFFAQNLIIVRYGKDSVVPAITYPRTFALRNDSDLTTEISEAKEASLPDAAMKKLMKEYFETRFGTDPEGQKIIDIIFYSDRLLGLSNDDVLKKITLGTVAKWEDILHTSIEMFIEEQIESSETFLDQDKKTQRDALITMAKAKDLEINPVRANVDNVLANANA